MTQNYLQSHVTFFKFDFTILEFARQEKKIVIDNINLFKSLIALSNELSAIRLQNDYLLQCEKNNALIDELSKEIKALVIVQRELKEDRERFIKKDKSFLLPIEKIDLELELLKNQKSMIVENMDLIDFVLKI